MTKDRRQYFMINYYGRYAKNPELYKERIRICTVKKNYKMTDEDAKAYVKLQTSMRDLEAKNETDTAYYRSIFNLHLNFMDKYKFKHKRKCPKNFKLKK
jgi:hypothetical protein